MRLRNILSAAALAALASIGSVGCCCRGSTYPSYSTPRYSNPCPPAYCPPQQSNVYCPPPCPTVYEPPACPTYSGWGASSVPAPKADPNSYNTRN